jgi:DNA repair exonuclease SbcCD ATPase subunit
VILELQNQVTNLRAGITSATSSLEIALRPQEPPVQQSDSRAMAAEMELRSRIQLLESELADMRAETKQTRDQIMKSKQQELTLGKRVQSLETLKKTADNALQTANEKIAALEARHEEVLTELKQQAADSAEGKSAENMIELKREYQKRMNDHAKEIHRANAMALDTLENKYRNQMRDIVAACEKGDMTRALDEAQKQFESKLADSREAHEKVMYEQRRKHDQQFMELTKQYEALLNTKKAEIERIQQSVEREVTARCNQRDIEHAEELTAKSLEIHDALAGQFATLKHDSTTVLTQVHRELAAAKRERDMLKSMLGQTGMASTAKKKRKRKGSTTLHYRNQSKH